MKCCRLWTTVVGRMSKILRSILLSVAEWQPFWISVTIYHIFLSTFARGACILHSVHYMDLAEVCSHWVFPVVCCVLYVITVGELVLKHRHINILLEGLDTIADVLLNNVLLVSARNMFQRFVIDVTRIIKAVSYTHLTLPTILRV